MITQKIIRAAEKAMPVEERLRKKLHRVFEKKPNRLIVSSITALALMWALYRLTCAFGITRIPVVIAVLGLITVMVIGAFFANIGEFSLTVFGISAGISSVLLYFALAALDILTAIDFSHMELLILAIPRIIWQGIFVCAIATAAAVLFARLITRRQRKA